MHRRAILCTMCGGKFFPSSMKFHEKVCARKQMYVMLPCPYCDQEVAKPDLDEHLKKCPMAPPKPSNIASPIPGGSSSSGLCEIVDDQGRMQCPVCERRFNQDRIAIHQQICKKLQSKTPRPKFDTFKQRCNDPLMQRAFPLAPPSPGNSKDAACLARSSYPVSARMSTQSLKGSTAEHHRSLKKNSTAGSERTPLKPAKASPAKTEQRSSAGAIAGAKGRGTPVPSGKRSLGTTQGSYAKEAQRVGPVAGSSAFRSSGRNLAMNTSAKCGVLPTNETSLDNPLLGRY